ncbi:hypothetical protein FD754_017856, partial [Muntiacus muntjak]
MQESQETHISNHLDEIVAAVSITPRKKLQNQLLQRALFQPPREKLRLSEEKAKSYASSHEYKKALHELVHCMALTRICYGDSHWKLAEAHVNLAKGYLQLKGMSLQAKQHAEKAKEILTSSIVPPYNDNTDVFKCSVELFHTLGQALLSLQKFKEASKNLTKAEILSKEMLQCGKIIKEEWMEIQARIKLSFIIPPSPSPIESKSLFYTSVSLFLKMVTITLYGLTFKKERALKEHTYLFLDTEDSSVHYCFLYLYILGLCKLVTCVSLFLTFIHLALLSAAACSGLRPALLCSIGCACSPVRVRPASS